MEFLTILEQDVELTVKPAASQKKGTTGARVSQVGTLPILNNENG
jgi:hypothetical protein